MAQSWCGKHKNKEDKKIELEQFYCENYKTNKKICAKQCELCMLLDSEV